MGVQLDALENNESDYVNAVFFAKDTIFRRQRTPWLFNQFIFENLPIGRSLARSIKVLHQHAFKVLASIMELFVMFIVWFDTGVVP